MQNTLRRNRQQRRGLTLLDTMFLTAILGVLAVGIGQSLQALAKVSEGNDEQRAISERVLSDLETLRNDSPATLTTLVAAGPTSSQVTILVGNIQKQYTETTTVQLLDPTNPSTNANPQADFISVQVTIGQCTSAVWVTAI